MSTQTTFDHDLVRGCLAFYLECRKAGETDAWQHVEAFGKVFDCHVERDGPAWWVTAYATYVDREGFTTTDLDDVVARWTATGLRRAAR